MPVQAATRPAPGESYRQNASGRPLNLDFEAGSLADWKAEGDAFKGQPIAGDTVHRRRGDMASRHAGRYWVGTYEIAGDAPRGTLTSVPFRVSKPFASFLVGGGSQGATFVELVRTDTGQSIFRASGDDRDDLERVVADLTAHLGARSSFGSWIRKAAAGATSISTISGCTTSGRPWPTGVVQPRLTCTPTPDSGPKRPRGR